MAFSSQRFYQGRLTAHETVKQRSLDDMPLEVIDTAGSGMEESAQAESRLNAMQAEITANRAIVFWFIPN